MLGFKRGSYWKIFLFFVGFFANFLLLESREINPPKDVEVSADATDKLFMDARIRVERDQAKADEYNDDYSDDYDDYAYLQGRAQKPSRKHSKKFSSIEYSNKGNPASTK